MVKKTDFVHISTHQPLLSIILESLVVHSGKNGPQNTENARIVEKCRGRAHGRKNL